jgi:hypothetical protein
MGIRKKKEAVIRVGIGKFIRRISRIGYMGINQTGTIVYPDCFLLLFHFILVHSSTYRRMAVNLVYPPDEIL